MCPQGWRIGTGSHARSGAMPVVFMRDGCRWRCPAGGPVGRGARAGRARGAAGHLLRRGGRDELIILAAGSPRPRAGMAGMHPAGTELILGAANSEPPGLREAEGGAQHPATRSEGRPHARDCG